MYYPLSAFLLLFANLLHNPEDPSVAADLQLMDLVISVLGPMIGDTGPYNFTATLQLVLKLRDVANEFIEKKNQLHLKKTKHEHDSDLTGDDDYSTVKIVSEQVTAPTRPPLIEEPGFMVSFPRYFVLC